MVTQEMIDEMRADFIPVEADWPPNLSEGVKQELRLRRALQEKICSILEQHIGEENPDLGKWEDFAKELDAVAKETTGIEYGFPTPSLHDVNRKLITARRVPITAVYSRTEFEQELAERLVVRNSWNVLGDKTVCVIADPEKGPFAFPRYAAGNRMRKMMDGALLRTGMAIDADTELRAMQSLKTRINKRQFDSYVLSGIFPEYSKRSDLHYFFRKGLPTLVLSYHDSSEGRIIAALCLHPVGYYEGSHVGLMTPTDEVISALLLMRCDEHKFWAASGQWSMVDPRAGV